MKGTLVVLVPTNAGLACAADGCSSIAGMAYPSRKKIIKAQNSGILHTATGNGTFYSLPPGTALTPSFVKDLLDNEDPAYDASQVVAAALVGVRLLTPEAMSQVRARVEKAFASYLGIENPPTAVGHRVVLAQFSPATRISTIGTFKVDASDGALDITNPTLEQISIDEETTYRAFGESDYLDSVVFTDGRSLFPKEFFTRISDHPTVANMSREAGIEMAATIVETAGRMTELVPAPTAIGGETQVVFLGD